VGILGKLYSCVYGECSAGVWGGSANGAVYLKHAGTDARTALVAIDASSAVLSSFPASVHAI